MTTDPDDNFELGIVMEEVGTGMARLTVPAETARALPWRRLEIDVPAEEAQRLNLSLGSLPDSWFGDDA